MEEHMYIKCVCVCVCVCIHTNIYNREVRESKERGGGGCMKNRRRKDGRGRRKEEPGINIDYLHGGNLGDHFLHIYELLNVITMKMLLFTTKKEIFKLKNNETNRKHFRHN